MTTTIDPFKKGTQVEVSLEEEGFRGSWFSATVISQFPNRYNPNKSRLLLEFHNLTTSSSDDTPLQQTVDIILVRPTPPRESRRHFNVGEDVDAFHDDGWWEGNVTAVLNIDGGGRRYSVYFRCSREQIDFSESQLRLHREWVYGIWIPPLEDHS
ncbi:hypothetical protein ACJIZ3_016552 [Penstemon smallii]|uniref:Agenet domain-containing protein n=1 Tax=Penstemon smallii TaxID=265156 RepID=A0ABD3ST03_9LAMI